MLVEILNDTIRSAKRHVEDNLFGMANMLNIALPFVMFFIGSHSAGMFPFCLFWMVLPACTMALSYIMRQTANRLGKGMTTPIPQKRFTECEEGGQVNIENSRLQELILYMADLEDWLKRQGLTKE